MAYGSQIIATPFGVLALLVAANTGHKFYRVASDWNTRRVTRKALSQLTAEQLHDIGLA